jgi:pyroglutamyl-peptidase
MAETVLLTGFEPYGGRGINPSTEVVKRLDGATVAGARVTGRTLPVSFRSLRAGIDALLEEVRPSAVVGLGLWPGEPTIRLERVALNLADFEIPDNEDLLLEDTPISDNAAPAAFATLPVRAAEKALLDAGIPARISNTAGTFLCNAVLSGFLAALAERGRAAPCGFVHLPYLPEQVAEVLGTLKRNRKLEVHQRADLASMSLETMVSAVSLVIETAVRQGSVRG